MTWLEPVAWVVVVLLSVPLLVLTVECVAAFPRTRRRPLPNSPQPRIAVLIPAHNEATGIARTLAAALAQLRPTDRVVVVADNCTDDTAAVARAAGAEVTERADLTRRGKGYALAHGRDALRADPPEVVIVLDADCLPGDAALTLLASKAAASGRPAQVENRLAAPAEAGPDRQVAAFAFFVKNVIRPGGLHRLGQPCLLTGTGMAFPWSVFQDASLGHGHIVEDMGLAIDLAVAGHSPVFVPGAAVNGEFPVDDQAAGTQRRRWEHGHLRAILTAVPKLLVAALRRRRFSLLVLALETGVPPLSALVLLTFGMMALLTLWAAFGGSPWPAVALAIAFGLASVTLFAVWCRYGRKILPPATLLRIPLYAIRKISLYLGFLSNPQRVWVRTARATEESKLPASGERPTPQREPGNRLF